MNAIPLMQRVIAVLWPSFIMAGVATILFTTAFDSSVIFFDYDISRIGSYSICFFLFWLFGAVTATATCYFLKPCEAMNKLRKSQQAENTDSV